MLLKMLNWRLMMSTDDYLTDQEYNDLVEDRDKWKNSTEKLCKIISKLYKWEDKTPDEILKAFK